MRILVTGSAGFIGSHVCQALLARGDEVIGFDNFNPYYDPTLKEARSARLETQSGFSLIRGDLTQPADLQRAFDALGGGGDTRVCHLAAQAGVRHSIDHPDEFITDNIHGFNHVIELCQQREVGGLIYASTSAVYGDNREQPQREDHQTDSPISLYGVTKKCNELQAYAYHSLHGLPCTGLRFFTVYGPWGRPDMALFLFTRWILADEPLRIFGQGQMRRDFTYVDDIVAGVVAALDRNDDYEIYNLGGGKTEELMSYIRVLEQALKREGRKEFLPMQPGDVPATSADITKARANLGYEPKTRIEAGVPRFVEWYVDYYRQR